MTSESKDSWPNVKPTLAVETPAIAVAAEPTDDVVIAAAAQSPPKGDATVVVAEEPPTPESAPSGEDGKKLGGDEAAKAEAVTAADSKQIKTVTPSATATGTDTPAATEKTGEESTLRQRHIPSGKVSDPASPSAEAEKSRSTKEAAMATVHLDQGKNFHQRSALGRYINFVFIGLIASLSVLGYLTRDMEGNEYIWLLVTIDFGLWLAVDRLGRMSIVVPAQVPKNVAQEEAKQTEKSPVAAESKPADIAKASGALPTHDEVKAPQGVEEKPSERALVSNTSEDDKESSPDAVEPVVDAKGAQNREEPAQEPDREEEAEKPEEVDDAAEKEPAAPQNLLDAIFTAFTTTTTPTQLLVIMHLGFFCLIAVLGTLGYFTIGMEGNFHVWFLFGVNILLWTFVTLLSVRAQVHKPAIKAIEAMAEEEEAPPVAGDAQTKKDQ